jgi:LPXTG-site transpeptidase (sortase) family protein
MYTLPYTGFSFATHLLVVLAVQARNLWTFLRGAALRPGHRRPGVAALVGLVILCGGTLWAFFPNLSGLYTAGQQRALARRAAAIEAPTEAATAAATAATTRGLAERSSLLPTEAAPPDFAPNWHPELRLRIPAIGVDAMVVEGVDAASLRKGPGHDPRSVPPGRAGLSVIAGHSSSYGAVFARLGRLAAGDAIIVETAGILVVFEVVGVREVAPDHKLEFGREGQSAMVLITCTPPGTVARRLLVTAVLGKR